MLKGWFHVGSEITGAGTVAGSSLGGNFKRDEGGRPMRMTAGFASPWTVKSYMVGTRFRATLGRPDDKGEDTDGKIEGRIRRERG